MGTQSRSAYRRSGVNGGGARGEHAAAGWGRVERSGGLCPFGMIGGPRLPVEAGHERREIALDGTGAEAGRVPPRTPGTNLSGGGLAAAYPRLTRHASRSYELQSLTFVQPARGRRGRRAFYARRPLPFEARYGARLTLTSSKFTVCAGQLPPQFQPTVISAECVPEAVVA